MTADPVDPETAAVARFDPVLRTLMTFRLVEPDDAEETNSDDVSRQWRLTPAVQRRLNSLAFPAPPADKLVYFGHRCSSCGEHAPTWSIAGAFLCSACRDRAGDLVPSSNGTVER
jgi:hypothetical protein